MVLRLHRDFWRVHLDFAVVSKAEQEQELEQELKQEPEEPPTPVPVALQISLTAVQASQF